MSRVTSVLVLAVFIALVSTPTTANGAFPGQNGKLAFWSTRTDPAADLFTVNPDGSALMPVRATPSTEQAPAWSPDGTRIAFSSNADGDYEIYVISADGSGVTQLTHDPALDQYPSWSPDGERLVFERAGQRREIFVIGSDGTGEVNLTAGHGVDERSPDWSPDGRWIAFIKPNLPVCDYDDECQLAGEITLMRPDGSDRQATGIASEFRAKWSPDGSHLAYAKELVSDYEIATVRRDGTGAQLVTSNAFDDHGPTWSPDGSKLAYMTTADDPNWPHCDTATCLFKIHTIGIDGTGDAPVTSGPGRDGAPDWQPITGPRREDFKNAAQFCKDERKSLGKEAFAEKYGRFSDCKGG